MNTIKSIHLLETFITPDQVAKLEAGALLYKRHSRIEFKIIIGGAELVEVRTVQTKSPAENYLSQKELIARTKDLFNQVLPGHNIKVHAIPYAGSVVDVVTSEWISKKMLDSSVSLKTIVTDTGIDKTSLSAVINGLKPLSQSMKAMFYYYFVTKEIEYKRMSDALQRFIQSDSKTLISILNKKSIEDFRRIMKQLENKREKTENNQD